MEPLESRATLLKEDKLIKSIKLPRNASTFWRRTMATPPVPPFYKRMVAVAVPGFILGYVVDNYAVNRTFRSRNV